MIVEEDIARVVDRITAMCDPDEVWVFGSYAKGSQTDKSDLDIVVVKPSELPRQLRGRNVSAALMQVAFGLDLLYLTPEEVAEELASPYSLLSTVMPTAKLVYRRES